MTLLDHVVVQVDDLNAIGDWYDHIVGLAGGARTFDTPTVIGYALPGQPTQLFFSLATDPDGRQTHLALGCGRSTDRTTTRCSSETRPETTSNSNAKPERHGQRSQRNPARPSQIVRIPLNPTE
jgi:hypothetical protein